MNYGMNNNTVLIEKYIDGQSSAEESLFVESMIAGDVDFREEYEYMKLAVSSVQLSGVHAQVSEAANAYFEEINTKEKKPAMIRSIGYYSMRAAAVLVVIVASYTAIIYTTATPEKLYSEAFTDYNPETVRSATSASAVEQEYRMGKWQEVIAELADIKLLSPKEMLLGGIAALHLNDPSRAQHFFQSILDNNNNTLSSGAFREESEFYLALTYIRLNKPRAAVKLLSAIKNNPHHLYYSQANRISTLELSILEWKN